MHTACSCGFRPKRKPKTDTEDVKHCVCAFKYELACYNVKCMKTLHNVCVRWYMYHRRSSLTWAWTLSVFSLTPTYTFISACLILFHVSCKTLRFCSQPDASFFFLHAERERENRLVPFVPPFNSGLNPDLYCWPMRSETGWLLAEPPLSVSPHLWLLSHCYFALAKSSLNGFGVNCGLALRVCVCMYVCALLDVEESER